MSALHEAARRVVAAWVSTRPAWIEQCNEAVLALDAALKAQAEPVEEPVAWRVMLDDDVQFVYDERMLPLIDESIHATRQPLYTAPPQRPPLTDEEIDKATAQERDALLDHIYEYGTAAEGVLERIRKLCRAIERKVRGEKE
jgi:hypothetical protein